jgi:anti-sigma factor RsiW
LSDYIDGELTPADRTACDRHLAECQVCTDVLRELQGVTTFAKTATETWPADDLWPSILARIEGKRVTEGSVTTDPFTDARLRRQPRRISFTLPQLALAASLLIAVSAGVAYIAAGRVVTQSAVRETPIQAQAEPMMQASADISPANFADAQYDQAVLDLEQILIDQRDALDPRTIMIIERNLTAIDEAIRQARAALDADPANAFLNSHLADARRRKLDLLRRAATIASPSGD